MCYDEATVCYHQCKSYLNRNQSKLFSLDSSSVNGYHVNYMSLISDISYDYSDLNFNEKVYNIGSNIVENIDKCNVFTRVSNSIHNMYNQYLCNVCVPYHSLISNCSSLEHTRVHCNCSIDSVDLEYLHGFHAYNDSVLGIVSNYTGVSCFDNSDNTSNIDVNLLQGDIASVVHNTVRGVEGNSNDMYTHTSE